MNISAQLCMLNITVTLKSDKPYGKKREPDRRGTEGERETEMYWEKGKRRRVKFQSNFMLCTAYCIILASRHNMLMYLS